MKPGGPARKLLSHSPLRSAVARKNISALATNSRIRSLRWSSSCSS